MAESRAVVGSGAPATGHQAAGGAGAPRALRTDGRQGTELATAAVLHRMLGPGRPEAIRIA